MPTASAARAAARWRSSSTTSSSEPVDLRAVSQDALATSQPLLEGARHRVVLRLSAEPLWVDGDRVRLAQVVSNLLNNAARYTLEGGEITLETRREGDEALVSVQDTGIGIEPAMLERVFEPFLQLGGGRGGIAWAFRSPGGSPSCTAAGSARIATAAAAAAASSCTCRSPRRRRPRPPRRTAACSTRRAGASWWSTTTSTPPPARSPCCACSATKPRAPSTAARR